VYTPTTSSPFDVTIVSSKLVFVQEPSDAQAGSAISPAVTVAVEDANGNVVTSDNATQITLAIATNPAGGTLTGGSAVTVVNGVATFPGLSVDKAATGYTLSASSNPAYTTATSTPFTISAGAAAQLGFVQQPTNVTAGSDIAPPVTVAIEDAEGNVVTTDNSTQVTLAIGTNPGGGTLGGGSAVTASSGVATFPGLSVDTVGTGYTLTATSTPALTGATSSPFDVTGGALTLGCTDPTGTTATPCQGIDLPPITLDGMSQTVQASGHDIYVTDTRGLSNLGWSVSAYLMPTASNANAACAGVATFCNVTVGPAATNPQGQIPASDLSIGSLTCTAVSGNSNPLPEAGPGGSFPAGSGAVSLCSAAAGHSAGTFKVGATYSLTVPEGVYAGQYQATVEYLAF